MILADLAAGAVGVPRCQHLGLPFRARSGPRAACIPLIQRIDRGDLSGFTSTHVLTETAHRLMASKPVPGLAGRLRAWPGG